MSGRHSNYQCSGAGRKHIGKTMYQEFIDGFFLWSLFIRCNEVGVN